MKMYESVVDLMEGVIVAAPICFKLLQSTSNSTDMLQSPLICVIDGSVVEFTWFSSHGFNISNCIHPDLSATESTELIESET